MGGLLGVHMSVAVSSVRRRRKYNYDSAGVPQFFLSKSTDLRNARRGFPCFFFHPGSIFDYVFSQFRTYVGGSFTKRIRSVGLPLHQVVPMILVHQGRAVVHVRLRSDRAACLHADH